MIWTMTMRLDGVTTGDVMDQKIFNEKWYRYAQWRHHMLKTGGNWNFWLPGTRYRAFALRWRARLPVPIAVCSINCQVISGCPRVCSKCGISVPVIMLLAIIHSFVRKFVASTSLLVWS
jgi:hypothetical protein